MIRLELGGLLRALRRLARDRRRWRRDRRAALEVLRQAVVAESAGRSEYDLARDFRRVLLGTVEGVRVLNAILAWGGVIEGPGGRDGRDPRRDGHAAPVDLDLLQRWAGQRDLAMRILTACEAPLPGPVRPARPKPEEA